MINEVPKYPAVRPEIESELAAIEGLLYELILRCQGSARELDQMAGVLDNYLSMCEDIRDSLLGLAESEPRAIRKLKAVPPDDDRLTQRPKLPLNNGESRIESKSSVN
jgi:hypothetical protein